MTRQLSLQDAAQHFNVSERTIRRRIKQGTLKADLLDGRYLVCVDSDMTLDKPDVNVLSCQLERADFEVQHLTKQVEEKTNQILYFQALLTEKDKQLARRDDQMESLTDALNHAHQLVAISQKSIQQLTEQNQLLLEDQRHRKLPVWKRVFRWT